jgi:hypothetical protein
MTDVTLREFIDRDTYPFPVGSAPDRFARQLAELVPGWRIEYPDYYAHDLWMSANGPNGRPYVTVIQDRPNGLEWTVDGGRGKECVPVRFTLGHDEGPAEFAVVIRVLRMLGVLPEAPSTASLPTPDRDVSR